MNIKSILNRLMWFIIMLLISIVSTKRYILLTPYFVRRQMIFDKKNKKLVFNEIRDRIDYSTLKQIYYNEDYSSARFKQNGLLNKSYLRILDSGLKPLIIDCGGNIGLTTQYLLNLYPEAKVLLIEPSIENITLAKKNNGYSDSVDYYTAAIGYSDGYGNITDPGLGNNGYRVITDIDGDTRIISIPTLISYYSINEFIPFIIKIDIEGFEKELFDGQAYWINTFDLIMIELHDWLIPNNANSNGFLKNISQYNRDFLFKNDIVFSFKNDIL